MYGTKIEPSEFTPRRTIVGGIETTASGNVVVRVGRENIDSDGWSKVGHIVLTRDEAIEFANEVLRAAGGSPTIEIPRRRAGTIARAIELQARALTLRANGKAYDGVTMQAPRAALLDDAATLYGDARAIRNQILSR